MIGIVLAAGGGTRLRPLTDDLPKTLLAVDGERSILELGVANLAAVGVEDVVVVTGHAAERVDEALPGIASRTGVNVTTRFNDRYADLNNAYSMWVVADLFEQGVLLVNGDTLHPASVERSLLAARGQGPLLIAVDDVKALTEEAMKVTVDDTGHLLSITKQMPVEIAVGEYIGVSLVEPEAGPALADALERTFREDPQRYYEDGYQAFVEAGGRVRPVAIGEVAWVEVDDHADLAAARALTGG